MKTGTGLRGTPGSGQFFRMDVTVGPCGRIEDARFHTIDCLWASTIGAMLRSRVTGLSIEEAMAFNEEHLQSLIEDIPRTHRALLALAIAAFRQAITNLQREHS
jgi:NifU-like protein involved in Fe-S cluster formation